MASLLPSFAGLSRPALALLGATFIDRVGTFVVTFLALYLKSERGLSTAEAGVIASLWGAGSLCGSPLGGFLADTFGRKRTLVTGYLGVALSLLLLSQAEAFASIGALAFSVGFCAALHRPAASASLADLVSEQDRPRAFALFHWVVNLAFSVSPVLGSLLVKVGFTTLFVVDAATGVLCAWLLWRWIPETKTEKKEEEQKANPLLALSDGDFWPFLVISLLCAAVFHQIDVTLPLDAQAHGVDVALWGPLLAINGVLIVVVQPALNRQAQLWPTHVVIGLGSFFVGCGFALHGVWPTIPGYAVGIALWTIGEILWAPTTQIVATRLAPAGLRGTYLGVGNVPHGMGFLLGPLLGSSLLDAMGPSLWWSCGAVGLVCVLLSVRLGRRWQARGV